MSSVPSSNARSQFAEMVSREDAEINLAEAALLIAAEEYPRLDIELYLARLDHFADLARQRAAASRDPFDVITAMKGTLFEELGFRGNRENYYDPRNSYLNEVIDRRTGIPITLTVVYIEVSKRIGFQVKGVGLPFHFIAKHEMEGGDLFIDPFNAGRLLDSAGCDALITKMSDGKLELRIEHLEAVTNKQILTRMLSNLLGVYSSSDRRRALAAIDRILLINPASVSHIRDRGLLLAAVGDRTAAILELERYLALAADATDVDTIREQIRSIRRSHARLN
ncbi:MAG TPA: transglutaminase-like domain-containing protein [Blastocatellia bacterium]|nr:transglutaminase-like domain-containing protein [Blastocatellia bacterium]